MFEFPKALTRVSPMDFSSKQATARTLRYTLKKMPYQPKPIDTSAVRLPEQLLALTERLAENAHELWAQQRLSDGWTHGSSRDDAAKRHPCLIPYSELPESEKQYDREIAMKTLKAIVALGYSIKG
jgi:hypothetical protein